MFVYPAFDYRTGADYGCGFFRRGFAHSGAAAARAAGGLHPGGLWAPGGLGGPVSHEGETAFFRSGGEAAILGESPARTDRGNDDGGPHAAAHQALEAALD